MKKRDLLVFAGQSNMMGAAVFPPRIDVVLKDSYEYKHNKKRIGAERGEFVSEAYPCGEFSYTEEALKLAYLPENLDENQVSKLDKYTANTYFCPAMCNLKNEETHEQYSFDYFSESTLHRGGPTLAPLFAAEWEAKGHSCAYAHIAKGGVAITHYFSGEMIKEHDLLVEEYNKTHSEQLPLIVNEREMWSGASAYFDRKVKDFFAEAEEKFEGEDLSNRIFVWCQGESDAPYSKDRYKLKLEVLWNHMRKLGFTHFFCVRVGYWPITTVTNNIHAIMQAQEEFCREHDDCYIITRAMSRMSAKNLVGTGWFTEEPGEKYLYCRDNYYGFVNPHINEKGFSVIAKAMADNAERVLVYNEKPILEKEIVAKIIEEYGEEN